MGFSWRGIPEIPALPAPGRFAEERGKKDWNKNNEGTPSGGIRPRSRFFESSPSLSRVWSLASRERYPWMLVYLLWQLFPSWCARSRVLKRGFWKAAREFQRLYTRPSCFHLWPKNRGVLIERPFHELACIRLQTTFRLSFSSLRLSAFVAYIFLFFFRCCSETPRHPGPGYCRVFPPTLRDTNSSPRRVTQLTAMYTCLVNFTGAAELRIGCGRGRQISRKDKRPGYGGHRERGSLHDRATET